MTVGELIALLRKAPEHATVFVGYDGDPMMDEALAGLIFVDRGGDGRPAIVSICSDSDEDIGFSYMRPKHVAFHRLADDKK